MATARVDLAAGIALATAGTIILVPFVAVAISSGASAAIDLVAFVAEDEANGRSFYVSWALISVAAIVGGAAYLSGCARKPRWARFLLALSLTLLVAVVLLELWILVAILGAASLFAFQSRNGA